MADDPFFFIFDYSLQWRVKLKFANVWIRKANLWWLKQPLYQLSHNQWTNSFKGLVAAIAQWIRVCLPSRGPGFESQIHQLCFNQLIFELFDVKKNEIDQKRGQDRPISKNIIKSCANFKIFTTEVFRTRTSAQERWTVWPDWAIFASSWQQIVSQKLPEKFGDFLGYF